MTDRKPRPLVAGNWKMHGTRASLAELESLWLKLGRVPACDVAVCPPFTLLAPAMDYTDHRRFVIGAQDCHPEPAGAHTGDIAAEMLADLGCRCVIVGHSERRQDHGEDDALVRAKAAAVLRAGMTAIVCVGERAAERDAGAAERVVERQLAGCLPAEADAASLIIAYEPVWAIGSGRTPSPQEIAAVHRTVRVALIARFGDTGRMVRILYGGSVKPANACELMAVENVDGALVGGASLRADDFDAIIEAYR
ncbi:MAG: triose-phosphate isomerase [Rhodothalassiaceae bacterium]